MFTYESTERMTELLKFLRCFVVVDEDPKVVWMTLEGKKKAALSSRFLKQNSVLFLNEAYIQIPQRILSSQLLEAGVFEATAHFNVSPNSVLWAHSSNALKCEKSLNRDILNSVRSSEKCAINRHPEPIPTVLEMTLKFQESNIQFLEIISDLLCLEWENVHCAEKFAVIDVGGEWLFFPKTGFNPDVLKIEIYNSSQAGRVAKSTWPAWRKRHNISIESDSLATPTARSTVHSKKFRER